MDRMEVIGFIATLIQVSLLVAIPLLLAGVVRWVAAGRWRRLAALFDERHFGASRRQSAKPIPASGSGKPGWAIGFLSRSFMEIVWTLMALLALIPREDGEENEEDDLW